MFATPYQDASEFLARTQKTLEANEAANSLMLGICLQLKRWAETGAPPPYPTTSPPYLTTVEDARGLVMAAVMTPPHKIVVHGDRQELGNAPELIVSDLIANDWPVPGVLGPTRAARALARTRARISGKAYGEGMRQRVYELKEVMPPQAIPGRLRVAVEDDVALISEWIYGFMQDAFTAGERAKAHELAQSRVDDGAIYVWEDGKPVSMAAKARPTSNGITVNLVYTPPELRRRGYATACVAGLSQLLLDSGWKFCALFTDLSNPTSNHIYQRIGYRPVCDFNEFIFGAAQ